MGSEGMFPQGTHDPQSCTDQSVMVRRRDAPARSDGRRCLLISFALLLSSQLPQGCFFPSLDVLKYLNQPMKFSALIVLKSRCIFLSKMQGRQLFAMPGSVYRNSFLVGVQKR